MITIMKVLVIALLTTLVVGWPGTPTLAAGDIFVGGINQVRAAQSLPPMSVDQELTNLAIAWSQTMANNGALSHSDLVTGITANWSRLGENVGVGGTAESVHAALLASPPHLANILGDFTYVGVGTVEAAGKLWVTEKFMTVFPSVVPTPKPVIPPPPPPTLPKPIVTVPPTTIPAPPPLPSTTTTRLPAFIDATIPLEAVGPVRPTVTTIIARLSLRQWLGVLFAKWRLGWAPTFA